MLKNLVYLSPRNVRKNRSDAVHIMLTCLAFTNVGMQVTLLTPQIDSNNTKINNKLYNLYGIENHKFRVIELRPSQTDISSHNRYSSFHSIANASKKFIAHFFHILSHLKTYNTVDTIVYSKCFISTVPYILLKKLKLINAKVVFELITPKKTFLHRFVIRNSDKIISMLNFVTKDLQLYYAIPKKKIFEPPMITQSKQIIAIKESKFLLRSQLNLDREKKYVLYAGKTGEKVKAVDYFIDAAKIVTEFEFLIVGANEQALKKYTARIESEQIDNLQIIPFQPLANYYRYVLASDILVGYYPATHHNKYHLSPGKSGVYLASKNPCIFSDLPSLRSIFPENTVFYAKPDDPKALAKTIRYVHEHKAKAKEFAKNAFEFAKKSTYENFTSEVLHFIRKTNDAV